MGTVLGGLLLLGASLGISGRVEDVDAKQRDSADRSETAGLIEREEDGLSCASDHLAESMIFIKSRSLRESAAHLQTHLSKHEAGRLLSASRNLFDGIC